MKYAIITDGVVKNIIEAEKEYAESISAVLFADGCEIGGAYNGSIFTPVPPPETPFSSLQESKIKLLSAMCKQAIIDGFDSDALGATHHYPAQPEDQTNLLGRVMQAQMNAAVPGWTVTFACADSNGVWDKPAHTAQQMIAVGIAGAQDVEAKTNRYTALAAQVMQVAGTDTAALAAITWSYP